MSEDINISLARKLPTQGFWINIALLVSFILFAGGIFAPLMTVTKFYFFDDTISILSGLGDLITHGEIILFIIIGVFSVIMPIVKILLLAVIWNIPFHDKDRWSKCLAGLAKYGKWSMLDVFVVAMLFVAIKLGMIVRVEIHYGLYMFAASVILTMIITAFIIHVMDNIDM